jgi:hypothetical protein
MSRPSLHMRSLCSVAALMFLGSIPAFSQNNTTAIDLADGTTVLVTTRLDKRLGFGPAQVPPSDQSQAPQGLAFYTANYTSFGKANPFNIVGTDPSLGAATTIVPTVIVPLKFVFTVTGGTLSLDGTNVVVPTQNSPIFQSVDFTTGGTDIGVTQYGDAIQRGEFWNIAGFSQGYHVLLGPPAIAPTVTVNVLAGNGNLYRLRSGGLLGVIKLSVFNALLAGLFPQYTANQLPIFQTDNVYLADDGTINTCCILGFHNSEGRPISTAHTWIYDAYAEPGTFRGDAFVDVVPLSHETAEWLNDPFVGAFAVGAINLIPPAILPNTGGACIINFETGDPLENPVVSFTETTSGTIYHLQDEVFLPWYLHSNPSFSVNGFYTFLGTYTTPSQLCGPG